jgi:hypothetical protein
MILLIIYLNYPKKKLLWYKCEKDKHTNNMFINALTANNYDRTWDNDWDIYLHCNDDFSNKTLNNIHKNNKNQKIFYINNSFRLGMKKELWFSLYNYYGRKIAETIIPPIYIFPKDFSLFKSRHEPNNYYILKNEKQRQEGIRLTKNINEIIHYKKNGYNFVQKYIQNPLLYNNYKLNFRIYLVIIHKNDNINSYVYNDVIITYAREQYDKNNINFNNTISSFYTCKKLYDDGFPILLSQLKQELNLPWNSMMKKTNKKIKLVVDSVSDKILEYKKNIMTFQLFGIDVMFDTDLNPLILEINVGPGMTPYNEYDKKMRMNLMHNIIELSNNKINNFILI